MKSCIATTPTSSSRILPLFEAQEKSEKLYLDRHSWARMQIINIANSGFLPAIARLNNTSRTSGI
jgi:hypothetical protein